MRQRAGNWIVLLLANLYLASPVVHDLGLTASDGRGIDKISLFAVPASVLWLALVQCLFRRQWLAHAVLFPFYVATAFDLFLVLRYDTRLSSSSISMILENLRLVPDFIRAQALPLIVATAVLLVLFAAAVFAGRNLVIRSRRPMLISLAGLAVLYGGLLAYRTRATGSLREAVGEIVVHDRNSPFGVLPQGYVAYRVYRDALEHERRAASFSFGATRPQAPAGPELYVLVVGESSRRDHWSLYGYGRETTPRLARQSNLVVLQDMVTQAALTQISVPLMITRAGIEDPDARANEKSIVAAFREAGFLTYWLSTQQRDHFTGAINRYSGEADHTWFLERRHDGALIDSLKEFAARAPGEKLFFVLHTQGSHFVFKDRYPASSARFSGAAGDRDALIEQYDNSIVYTDEVLARLISWLETRPGLAGLFYVADHGENLYDDGRQLFGHFLNNEYDMPVPALLWMSDAWAQAHPEMREAARTNASRKLNTRVVFSTLADLAGIRIRGMDVSKLSVFSPGLSPGTRLFRKRDRLVDLDEWRAANVPPRSASRSDLAE